MKPTLCLAILIFAPVVCTASCPTGQPREGSALIRLEQTWAQSLERHDADAIACILAPEFQEADPEGNLHDRAETLANVSHRRPGSNQLSELDPHVYGDFGYIRGLATLVDPDGKVRAQVRFTDIYSYRDGRWLAVAAHESLRADHAK